jgi:hypothetical protein
VHQLSSKLSGIIDLLCDGNCYSQSELQNVAQLKEYQARAVIAFLIEFGFAEMRSENAKLRITNVARKLFAKSI